MRWVRGVLPLLALAGVLVGCTGTTESVPPLLLVLGRLGPASGNPELTLIEDNFPNQPRFTVVASSQRSLPYNAVADDVTDRSSPNRATGSSNLVVLTRDNSGANSALVTFGLSGIDPSNPTAFAQVSYLQLTGGTNPAFTSSNGGPGPWCFSELSVSLSGRYVYLIDDPNACAAYPTAGAPVRLYQLDTSTRAVTAILSGYNVQATAPYDDQAQTNEQAYFLVSATTYAQLWAVPVPFDPGRDSPAQVATMPGTSQLALMSNGSALLSVTNANPYGAPSSGAASDLESLAFPPGGTASSVNTVDSARALAVDPTSGASELVVPGYDRIAVHASPSDSPPAETASGDGLSGVAATIDPANVFGYVANNGYLVLLDLPNAGSSGGNWYQSTTNPSLPTYVPANELRLPADAAGRYVSVLAWTRTNVP